MDTATFLEQIIAQTQDAFDADKSLLSFGEYLDVVIDTPKAQARDAATYMRDVFLHYGTEVLERPYGALRRFKLFDAPFDAGRDPLIGQELVQERVFNLLEGFVQEGRISKLILLHGPNGSAKSSFIACVMRAMEAYSQRPEGALYTFNWVFPSSRLDRGSIGFGGGRTLDQLESFAHLVEGDVDAKIRTETRDHPLLLLPRARRIALLRELLGEDARLPESLTEGELSAKARSIYDALLKAYKGDLGEVLKHVQVERFHISRRYRQAAVTVDPQMRVDASVRQVTADRSLGSLPPSLQNLALFEPMGDLVEANRGVIEFNDLLKRPIEAFKYLLSTCENGTARLDTMTLYLDAVFLGSCNGGHLAAFKEIPDFASFKARIELVQVPYLVDYTLEAQIYAPLVDAAIVGKPTAPHTTEVAALWAVLSRLERQDAELHPKPMREILQGLTPLHKAILYAEGTPPAELPRDQRNALTTLTPALFAERSTGDRYEGRFGPSPRELKTALLDAARHDERDCLTPLAVIQSIRELCEQTSVYGFLRLAADGDFHRPGKNVDVVEQWYLHRVEEELHQAMGLVDAKATSALFVRYIDNVIYFVRKEKRRNPLTGRDEPADETVMQEVEGYFGAEAKKAEDFRAGVMHRIAAWRMDHPDDPLDFDVIFADRIARLNEAFYDEKRRAAERIKRELLTFMVDGADRLEPEAAQNAEQTLGRLEADFGYCRSCAIEVIGYLLKQGA